MPCHHCGKARKAVRDYAKAIVKGDMEGAVRAATEAGKAIAAKLKGQDEDAETGQQKR